MLIYNKIYSQQRLNRRKWLLKRKVKRHTVTSLLFLFASKCFVDGFVERLLRIYIAEHQCVILYPQQFNTFGFVCKSAEYGTATYMSGFYYFDELMKVYINIKNIRGLHPHQVFNKRVLLMKRESRHSGRHRFSFSERFDETLMKCYFICISILEYPIINSSDFHPSSSLLWKR